MGSNGFYMIELHVGHDCKVGDSVILTNTPPPPPPPPPQATALGGHCEIGDYVIVGGLAAVHQFSRVGKHAIIGGLAGRGEGRDPVRLGVGQPTAHPSRA